MVIGVGVALSTSLAVLGAFAGGRREFVRTPKFGIDGTSGSWRGKRYGDRAPWGGIAELALGLYCACAVWLFWQDGQYALVPFLALYTIAFACYGAAVWLLRDARGTGVTVAVLAVAALARLALLPAAPTLSTDAYRYLWDARVARAGISPYASTILSAPILLAE